MNKFNDGDNMSRGIFLHPPPPEVIKAWVDPVLPPVTYDMAYEAQCSSWIEREADSNALFDAMCWDSNNLSESHSILMTGKWGKYPGQWRPYNVVVGNHVAPNHALVPSLMSEFTGFLSDSTVPTFS